MRPTVLFACLAVALAASDCGSDMPSWVGTVNGLLVVNADLYVKLSKFDPNFSGTTPPCPNGATIGEEIAEGWFSCGDLTPNANIVPADECVAIAVNETQRVALSPTAGSVAMGTFTLHFNGASSARISPSASAFDVHAALEAVGVPCGTAVTRTGSSATGYTWDIHFQRPGDVPMLTVDTTNLTGASATVDVRVCQCAFFFVHNHTEQTVEEGMAVDVQRTEILAIPLSSPTITFQLMFDDPSTAAVLAWDRSPDEVRMAVENFGLSPATVTFTETPTTLFFHITYPYSTRRTGNLRLSVVDPNNSGAAMDGFEEVPMPVSQVQILTLEEIDPTTTNAWNLSVEGSNFNISMPFSVGAADIITELESVFQVTPISVTLVRNDAAAGIRVFEIVSSHLGTPVVASSDTAAANIYTSQPGCGWL